MALYWIRRARRFYLLDIATRVENNDGMCWCFYVTCPWYLKDDFRSVCRCFYALVPEFNYHFMTKMFPPDLDVPCLAPSGFWWRVSDYRSRVSAFDYLVRVYETKLSKCSYFKW